MKTFIFENPEVYIVQYKVNADTEEEARNLFKDGDAKEVDLWYHDDLDNCLKMNTEPDVYEE